MSGKTSRRIRKWAKFMFSLPLSGEAAQHHAKRFAEHHKIRTRSFIRFLPDAVCEKPHGATHRWTLTRAWANSTHATTARVPYSQQAATRALEE